MQVDVDISKLKTGHTKKINIFFVFAFKYVYLLSYYQLLVCSYV